MDLEYVLVHRGGRGQSFVYELMWDGEVDSDAPFMMGLIDPSKIGACDEKFEPPLSPQRALIEPLSSGVRIDVRDSQFNPLDASSKKAS